MADSGAFRLRLPDPDSGIFEAPPEPERLLTRPRTRAACSDVPRPCPWASCRHNLTLDVGTAGAIKLHHDPDLTTMPANASCALDIAGEYGAITAEQTAEVMGVSKQYVLKLEAKAVRKLKRKGVLIRRLTER